MSDDSLRSVVKFLQDHPHPHLTPNVVKTQATLVDDPKRPGAIVFDVEKRTPALGARYRGGGDLSAFERSWERFCFYPEQATVVRIGTNAGSDQRPTVTITSLSGLLQDYVLAVWGLVERAWP